MSLVRTCDACGNTTKEQPNTWDWFAIDRGVGAYAAKDGTEACSFECAIKLVERANKLNIEAWEAAEAEASSPRPHESI